MQKEIFLFHKRRMTRLHLQRKYFHFIKKILFHFFFLDKTIDKHQDLNVFKKEERAAISANNQKDDRATFSCASARNRARAQNRVRARATRNRARKVKKTA